MQRDRLTTRDPGTRGGVWRGAVACVVAYALVITALLSSVLQANLAAQAAAGLGSPHCITGGAGFDPAAPAGQPDDGSHCPLCTLAAGPAVLPAAPAVAWSVSPVEAAVPPRRDDEPAPTRGHPARLPRGPPAATAV